MIPNRNDVLSQIAGIITGHIAQINSVYRGGPSLHFYHRIMGLRRQYPCVSSFLSCDACVEILYATLVSWDMNSRGAKMKDYVDFKSNLQENSAAFQAVETASAAFAWTNRVDVIQALSTLYDSLALMKTNGKVVSNSKCLHFVFPDLCLPMDRTNTLKKLYGNTGDSKTNFWRCWTSRTTLSPGFRIRSSISTINGTPARQSLWIMQSSCGIMGTTTSCYETRILFFEDERQAESAQSASKTNPCNQ